MRWRSVRLLSECENPLFFCERTWELAVTASMPADAVHPHTGLVREALTTGESVMKTSILGLITAVLVLGPSADAQAAASANFQGLCTWNSGRTQFSCNFDAQRPASNPSACPGSFIWKYQWDFDDGSTLLTGNPIVGHVFPNNQDRFVTLTVICWNGETPTRLRHVCTQFGTGGCLKVNGTWN
jgi:hypothetical protein